jgi:hypothetical protein
MMLNDFISYVRFQKEYILYYIFFNVTNRREKNRKQNEQLK